MKFKEYIILYMYPNRFWGIFGEFLVDFGEFLVDFGEFLVDFGRFW